MAMRSASSCLIFDLDGTISDPALGIGRSLNHALAAFGYPEIAASEVPRYIGPPLDFAFREITRCDRDETIQALVACYRERYGEIGYAENSLYPGIPEALRNLAAAGVRLGICTTKRIDFAERILRLFELRPLFAFVDGGDIGITKHSQLRSLLDAGIARRDAIMIGDRAGDVLAARAVGMRSAAVLWGHGSRRELEDAGPDRMLATPEELADLVEPI